MPRRRFMGAALGLLSALPHAAGAAVPARPATPTGGENYRLVKNWDFSTLIRDEGSLRREFHTRYLYANGTLDHLNDEWSRYRDNDNHVFTPEGLALVARPAGELAEGKVESGMLRSRWTGQHGIFEARMKVPPGRGLWPAFWLNPEDGRWPPEIDVVEIVNNGRDTTRRSFHMVRGKRRGKVHASRLNTHHAYMPGHDYADDFHVFSVQWLPGRVRHFVDGVMVSDRDYAWQHEDGSDGGPAHVLVNLAVGGRWPGPPEPSSLPARLHVAWIRVWQR